MRGWSLGVALTALTLTAVDARAWRPIRECDGRAGRWEDGPPFFRLHPVWGDPATDWGQAFERAMTAWNNVAGAHAIIDWRREAQLDQIGFSNGRSEVTVVRQAALDGSLGLTRTRNETCPPTWMWWRTDNGQLIEADVMIAGDTTMYEAPVPNCDEYDGYAQGNGPTAPVAAQSWRATREATIIHELGHALGLGHENDVMTLMMERSGEGRYCGTPQFAPHPDEIGAMQALYGDGRVQHDLAASSMRFARSDRVDMTMPRATVTGCAGRLVEMSYSVANRGTEPLDYDVFWYASEAPYAAEILLGVRRGQHIEPWRYETREETVRISRWQTPGVPYYVSFVLVPHVDREIHRDNNLSYTATRIALDPPGACP